jgi:hypothetical protein
VKGSCPPHEAMSVVTFLDFLHIIIGVNTHYEAACPITEGRLCDFLCIVPNHRPPPQMAAEHLCWVEGSEALMAAPGQSDSQPGEKAK